jgi:hypothetical protein
MFKDKSGKISIEELQAICEQLKLPVEDDLLNSLLSYCDVDGDKQIDYEEFCKFLNWQNAWQDELMYHQQTSKEVSRVLIDNSHYRLIFYLRKKVYSRKEHTKMSNVAKFGGEMM